MNKLLGILALVLTSATATAQDIGYLSGWYTDGNYTVCQYTSANGGFAIYIDVTEVCPTTINLD